MMPGMNSRQAQQMMKKMGIQQIEIDAVEVIIKTADKEYVFTNPQVSKMNMMGQEMYQVVGHPEQRALDETPDIDDDDVQTVMDQTGVSEEDARKAIENSKGDLADAIMKLK